MFVAGLTVALYVCHGPGVAEEFGTSVKVPRMFTLNE